MLFWKRKPAEPSVTHDANPLWLVKHDPESKWFCRCAQGPVNVPYHDKKTFPDGGNGWLFTCVYCGKAFMFAKAVRIRKQLKHLAALNVPRKLRVMDPKTGTITEHVTLATVHDWVAAALPLADGLVEGRLYVFFDGRVLPAVPGPVKFRGLWREHDLPGLPHLGEAGGEDTLHDMHYWINEPRRE